MSRSPARTALRPRSLRELLEEIRRVNPTGRGLSAAKARLRYEEKARLQSELIARFGASLRVRAHADMPGIVSLDHLATGESAGHAVVDELADVARAWVELRLGANDGAQLSVPTAQSARRPATSDAAPVSNARLLLSTAAQARAAFDYEGADAALRGALRCAASHAERDEALVELLRFLVDDLGDVESARRLEPLVEGETGPSEALLLLARAETRCGHLEHAWELARHARALDGREVLWELAEAASKALEVGVLAGVLARLGANEGDAATARRAALLRRATTARLENAARECPELDVRRAREVLRLDPQHSWALARVAAEEERLALEAAGPLLQRIDAALERGDDECAGMAIKQLRRGRLTTTLRATIARVEQTLAADRDERARSDAIARLERALTGRDDVEALAQYTMAPPLIRAGIRERPARMADHLARIDRLTHATDAVEARRVAHVMLALDDAVRASATDPDRTLALLGPDEPIARQLMEAAEALEIARCELQRRHDAKGEAVLRRAWDALAAEGADAACRIAEPIRRAAPSHGTAIREELLLLDDACSEATWARRLDVATSAAELTPLCAELRAWHARATPDVRAHWDARVRSAEARLLRAWGVKLRELPMSGGCAPGSAARSVLGARSGLLLVAASCEQGELIVRIRRDADHLERHELSFEGVRLDRVRDVSVGDTHATLLFARGDVLRIDLATGRPVLYWRADAGGAQDDAFLVGDRWLWSVSAPECDGTFGVCDVESPGGTRSVGAFSWASPIEGAATALVAARVRGRAELVVLSERGSERRRLAFPVGEAPLCAAARPADGRLTLAVRSPEGHLWILTELPSGWWFVDPLAELRVGPRPRWLCSRTHGLMLAGVEDTTGADVVASFGPRGGGASVLRTIRVPRGAGVVADSGDGRVYVAHDGERGACVMEQVGPSS